MHHVYSYIDLTSVLIGLIVFAITGYWMCTREKPGIPPGPSFLPILGNILDLGRHRRQKHLYFSELKEKYGPVFRLYLGSKLMIVLNDVDAVDEAFVKQKDILSKRPSELLWGVKQSITDGAGVIWANDSEWRSHRRMAIQTLRDLGVGKLAIEERIQEEAEFLMDTFKNNEPLDIGEILIKATTNIISIVVFGSRWEYNDPEMKKIVGVMESAFQSEGSFSPIHEFSALRFLPILSKKFTVLQKSIQRIKEHVHERVKGHEETYSPEFIRDFIDAVFTQIGKNPSDQGGLERTIVDFFIAGSDTTASSLTWAFLYVILNLDVQSKCQKEIDEIVGQNRKIDMSDRQKLPYVEATLLEAQRLGSIAPFAVPHTPLKDTMVKGYLVPADSLVFAHTYACHRDPKVWTEPLKFNPDRFLDQDGKLVKHPASFMPFSVGPRSCPGDILAKMELFLFFTSIIQRYRLSKVDENDDLNTDGLSGITMSPAPFKLRANIRQ
ncbi:hypothetical protein LOTGIDRAFT_125746 [Lottia gigantea]|uniref:Uncharacterized protein n=1 Tax=Lottia gigantea TaxID=225164 RepID=V3ZW78_LOTGI|nr:hypothetical protein LOTGIDRAFT_125746 [Lottia gigantea]ESO88637.1 hypothetical protein LOTGIDRAFT_125746 [Lottia gigantea]